MSDFTQEELEQLRRFFLEEARETMDEMDRAIEALDVAPADGAALSALLRKLHTLKGSAGSVALEALSQAAHEAEDLVIVLRDAGRTPTRVDLAPLVAAIVTIRNRMADAARLVSQVPHGGDARSAMELIDGLHMRVEVARVDDLLGVVGQLVIDRARIARRLIELEGAMRDLHRQLGSDLAPESREAMAAIGRSAQGVSEEAERLYRTSARLQDRLERIRTTAAGRLFARLESSVQEWSRRTGKSIALRTVGERIAIDKAVAERITDSLLHLLRNAVAHGLESPSERVAVGKPAVGTIELVARQRGAELVLEVADDGAGVDIDRVRAALGRSEGAQATALSESEVLAAIFQHGLSTREAADELAGRGVGLDAVKEVIESLGGTIACSSMRGQGTRFVIRLPLTTAIIRAQLFKVGGDVYAVPAVQVVETGAVAVGDFRASAEGDRLRLRGRDLPLVRLGALLGEPPPPGPSTRRSALVLEEEGRQFCVTCDKLIGPRDIVIKGLGPLLSGLPLFAGATISGAGKVQLVFDVAVLAEMARSGVTLGARPSGISAAPRILLADDSRSVREMAALLLGQGGYRVEMVSDGWEAWELLQDRRFDLLLTDGEMPQLDGYELVAKVRHHAALQKMPVLLMTAHASETTRERALAAGADQFLEKPLRRQELFEALAQALQGTE